MILQSLLRYQYIFFSLIFLLRIINEFVGSENLNYILGIMAILMLSVSFFGATRLFKILGGSFLIVGGYLFSTTELAILEIPSLLTSNLLLLALLSMLPWMNSIVRSGRFDRSLNVIIKVNVSDLGKLYPRSSITTHIMAAFLNLPAATISQDLLKTILSPLDKKLRNSFISTATLRGYSLALLWSPLEIMVAVSIFATGVNYMSLFPWLILIAVITFSVDSIWGRFHFKKYSYDNVRPGQNKEVHHQLNVKELIKKIAHLAVSLVVFLTLVVIVGNTFDLSFILTVTLLMFPFALIWALLMKRLQRFWIVGSRTWVEKTNSMQNFIVLFISLSFFSNSLNNTSFLEMIEKPLSLVSGYPLVILFLIQVIFVFLSMFGIHPIATVGILTGIITPLLEIMNPVSIAIALIAGSSATFTVGTYGLLVTLTSMNTEQSPYRITLTNMPFALVISIISTIVAYLIL